MVTDTHTHMQGHENWPKSRSPHFGLSPTGANNTWRVDSAGHSFEVGNMSTNLHRKGSQWSVLRQSGDTSRVVHPSQWNYLGSLMHLMVREVSIVHPLYSIFQWHMCNIQTLCWAPFLCPWFSPPMADLITLCLPRLPHCGFSISWCLAQILLCTLLLSIHLFSLHTFSSD